MSYEYKSGTQLLEERYVTFDEVGLIAPDSTGGSLWTFGSEGFTGLPAHSSPAQIGTLNNWNQVTNNGGNDFLGVKTDGTLWAMGGNGFGVLGLGDTTSRSSPVQVGSLTNWKQVVVTMYTSLAVKTDGTLWAWGSNRFGSLGQNDYVHRSSPVQVGSLTNWKTIGATSFASFYAVKTDGTLWSWGCNYYGRLGLGDTTHRLSPVQVGTLSNWRYVGFGYHHIHAVKTDGTLWGWGSNYYGDLGIGSITGSTATGVSSPSQIGTLTNWKLVSGGQYHSVATKTDGTLWTWGRNAYGNLGVNDKVHRSSPVQVGALTNWKYASSGTEHNVAVKTDGTLWAWGKNSNRQLGQSDTSHRSSPVQVGALTSWKSIAVGFQGSSNLLRSSI